MNSIEEARQAIARLASKNRYEVMIETTAIFTELMEPYGIKPVIVGGLAVEIYTRGQYTTQDIDLILGRRELANEIFLQLGFIKEGRHWFHPEIDIGIEIPNDVLEDADEEKIIKLHLPSGRYVYVIGIEDIILDRLRACIYWQSTSDCEWGLRMLKVHRDRLDIDYMLSAAGRDYPATLQKLKEWLNE
ncbi:hypothetical protein [Moorella sp. Hama-1]|uniref:hypothetical protein n=1 Tax=Moorella sp. Hama-1 TaxID=2138101 RepID=UPI000D64163E|nr:hypothetical protein [Moorella sp. Hama-1]MDN5362461.1 hypothetical protein [Moorella sp. (in: firmicutes)]BCV20930.1 hypothetical protein hamaS1_09990 [Moorella sp. Hama-1]